MVGGVDWGGGGGCTALKASQSISLAREALLEWCKRACWKDTWFEAATAVNVFLKWTCSFPSRLNTAVVSCLPSGHLVLYAHAALAFVQWLGHLNVEHHVGFFHQGPVRYDPPFPASNVFQESWYISLQKMCCLSPQQRDGATLKAFLTASMCVHRGMLSCPYLTISSKWKLDRCTRAKVAARLELHDSYCFSSCTADSFIHQPMSRETSLIHDHACTNERTSKIWQWKAAQNDDQNDDPNDDHFLS